MTAALRFEAWPDLKRAMTECQLGDPHRSTGSLRELYRGVFARIELKRGYMERGEPLIESAAAMRSTS